MRRASPSPLSSFPSSSYLASSPQVAAFLEAGLKEAVPLLLARASVRERGMACRRLLETLVRHLGLGETGGSSAGGAGADKDKDGAKAPAGNGGAAAVSAGLVTSGSSALAAGAGAAGNKLSHAATARQVCSPLVMSAVLAAFPDAPLQPLPGASAGECAAWALHRDVLKLVNELRHQVGARERDGDGER